LQLIITPANILLDFMIFSLAQQPLVDRVSQLSRLHDHTQTHHSREGSPGRVIKPSQELLTKHNTHKRQTTVHRRDSKPQSQHARGRRPKPYTRWQLESAMHCITLKNVMISQATLNWERMEPRYIKDNVGSQCHRQCCSIIMASVIQSQMSKKL